MSFFIFVCKSLNIICGLNLLLKNKIQYIGQGGSAWGAYDTCNPGKTYGWYVWDPDHFPLYAYGADQRFAVYEVDEPLTYKGGISINTT